VVCAVGLSNILGSELRGREPGEGPHGEVVGTAVVAGQLLGKVVHGVKTVAGIEPFPGLQCIAGTTFTPTWTRSPGWGICWKGLGL
jgi:hypothetical protein